MAQVMGFMFSLCFAQPERNSLYKASQKCEPETSEIAQAGGDIKEGGGEGMGKKQNTKTASTQLSVLGLLESF